MTLALGEVLSSLFPGKCEGIFKENALTKRVQARMMKSFPLTGKEAITRKQRALSPITKRRFL